MSGWEFALDQYVEFSCGRGEVMLATRGRFDKSTLNLVAPIESDSFKVGDRVDIYEGDAKDTYTIWRKDAHEKHVSFFLEYRTGDDHGPI